MAQIALPRSAGPVEIRMFDMQGRNIREIGATLRQGRTVVAWDGRNAGGMRVGPGNYIVRVSGSAFRGIRFHTGAVERSVVTVRNRKA